MNHFNLHKYAAFMLFYILVFNACDSPKNETKIYYPEDLKTVKKVALITFCAKEKVTIGRFSGDFDFKSTAKPELVQSVSKNYAIKLHNTLLKEINLVSLNSIKTNEYYRSIKDTYPLEYKVKRLFWWSPRKIINALPDLTVYIPESETGVFVKLASNLNVDAILWVMCDFFLDIQKKSSLVKDSSGLWTGEVFTRTKLFSSEGKLIWEASHFYKSRAKEGADKSWWQKIDRTQRIDGKTQFDLLVNASEVSIKPVVSNLKSALR